MMVTKSNTLYIPFSRGVKIFGNVTIERDPNSPAAKTPLDLSRIKISASDGKVYNTLTDNQGFYELYLPYGNYVLTMDENVLGEKFKLMQNNYQLEVSDSLNNLFIPFHIIEKVRKFNVKHANNNVKPNNTTGDNTITNNNTGQKKDTTIGKNLANNNAINQNQGKNNTTTNNNTGQKKDSTSGKNLTNNIGQKKDSTAGKNLNNNLGHKKDTILVKNLTNNTKIDTTQNKSKQPNGSSTNPEAVKGLFFTVQVGTFKEPPDLSKFNNLDDLVVEKINDKKYRVCSGVLFDLLQVNIHKEEMVKKGFKDAYITAYYKGKRITMAEAKKIYFNR
jgi:hypothetical protein